MLGLQSVLCGVGELCGVLYSIYIVLCYSVLDRGCVVSHIGLCYAVLCLYIFMLWCIWVVLLCCRLCGVGGLCVVLWCHL